MAVGIVKPHLPFDAPARFFDALPDQITPPEMIENDSEDIPVVGRSMQKKGEYNHYKSKGVWNDVRKSYLACISWADYNIGRVIKNLLDEDIIVSGGGHNMAAGFSLSKENLKIFNDYILEDFKKNINLISKIGGVILLITGILILTNQLQIVGFYLIKIFPFMQNFG